MNVVVPRVEERKRQYSRSSVERLDDGVYYFDLGRASIPDITAAIDRMSAAPGVVFDLRGYANVTAEVLSYLFDHDSEAKGWLEAPRIIRPDHVPGAIPAWQSLRTPVQAKQPHISGRIALLSEAQAYSASETILSIVAHHRLGEIVGSASAGVNGTMIEFTTPGGCRARLTGRAR
jgi:hypothetical protein